MEHYGLYTVWSAAACTPRRWSVPGALRCRAHPRNYPAQVSRDRKVAVNYAVFLQMTRFTTAVFMSYLYCSQI